MPARRCFWGSARYQSFHPCADNSQVQHYDKEDAVTALHRPHDNCSKPILKCKPSCRLDSASKVGRCRHYYQDSIWLFVLGRCGQPWPHEMLYSPSRLCLPRSNTMNPKLRIRTQGARKEGGWMLGLDPRWQRPQGRPETWERAKWT